MQWEELMKKALTGLGNSGSSVAMSLPKIFCLREAFFGCVAGRSTPEKNDEVLAKKNGNPVGNKLLCA